MIQYIATFLSIAIQASTKQSNFRSQYILNILIVSHLTLEIRKQESKANSIETSTSLRIFLLKSNFYSQLQFF